MGGTWAYRIDLGAVRGGGRNQKQVAAFGSREEAEAALAEALAAYGGGDRRTVAGFLELVWLPVKRLEIDRSTFDQYVWAVRRHIVPTLGRCKLAELEPRMIEGWLRGLGRGGRTDGGRPLSAASVRLVRKVLSMACEDAVEGGVLGDNPLRRVAAPPVEGRGAIGWTVEEADRFLGAARGHRLGAVFDLIVLGGLRRGEVLGLRWSDLDLVAGRLRVAQQLMVEGGRARLKPVPERHRRTVGLPAGLVHLLAEHRGLPRGRTSRRRSGGKP